MAFGQIDPARLEGDALRRWYLRSPERLRRLEQAHRQFYGGIHSLRAPNRDDSSRSAGDTDPISTKVGAQAAAYAESSHSDRPAGPRRPQATVDDCIDCHGAWPSIPPPQGMLPPFGKFPLPGGFPTFRDLPGGAPPPPRREERKQCEMQENSDRGICSQQPTEQAKAVCYSNIAPRRDHCDQTGEIGIPSLFRARRKSGRPWP